MESTADREVATQNFDDFYRSERPQQVRRAFLMLNCADTAHDVVAESFTAVIRRWDQLANPGPYLNRCVLNACRSVGANRQLKGTEPLDEAMPPLVDGSQESVEFARILADLPFRQRAAVVCRYYGRMTENEIADLLDCRPGTVGPLIHRGLHQLRKELS